MTGFHVRFDSENCINLGYLDVNEQLKYEPHHEKTGFLHMRKQRRRSASP